ncbi:hypothetical protein L7F22_058773 [Adiantum nelumboides]|nr:hypothetical protein [Adiantum nelumboides]
MRIIVPLQGVVQGRGGVFWGSVIPCGLFYLLQLYIRQRRPSSSEDGEGETGPVVPPSEGTISRTSSNNDVNNEESANSLSVLHLKNPKKHPPFVSKRAIAASDKGDSPYYIGWTEYYRDPYHATENPHGVIQLGLAENTLSLDLLQDWMKQHPEASLWNEGEQLSLMDVAPYQYSHGMPALKSAGMWHSIINSYSLLRSGTLGKPTIRVIELCVNLGLPKIHVREVVSVPGNLIIFGG